MAASDDIIHRDHVNLDKVLSVLKTTVDQLADGNNAGDTKSAISVLNSIVYYIRTFPDRMHHPKEEAFLFPLLVKRRPEAQELVSKLEDQHKEGDRRINDLNDAVYAFDLSSEASRMQLKSAAYVYIDYQRQHIGMEERELLPMARESLLPADWKQIQKAFSKDSDPLFGDNMETGFRMLFERITRDRA